MATLAASQRITVGPFCRKGLRNLLRPATRSRLHGGQPIAVERASAREFALRQKSPRQGGPTEIRDCTAYYIRIDRFAVFVARLHRKNAVARLNTLFIA